MGEYNTVYRVQQALQSLGIYIGELDGIDGPLTKNAVEHFQEIHGLTVDGIFGPETMEELFPSPIADRTDGMFPQAQVWPHESKVARFYGERGENIVRIDLPYPMQLAWDKAVFVHRMGVNRKVADSASRCFDKIASTYTTDEITDCGFDIFGGCLNVRKMRGGNRWSMHSWGIAIDFDPARNRLRWGRDRARLARPDCDTFWRIWEDEGWTSLGRTRNYDWMHIQAAHR